MANVSTESLTCPNCNAHLNPPLDKTLAHILACEYCGHKVRMKPLRPPPSAQLQVRVQVQAPQWQVESYRLNKLFFILPVVLLLIGGVVASFVTLFANREGAAINAIVSAATGDEERLPIICTGPMNLMNRSIRGAGTLVEAKGNCDLSILNSALETSGVALVISGNAQVNLINSTVRGRGVVGVRLLGSGSVDVKNSNVFGGGAAVEVGGHATATFSSSNIKGGTVAVRKLGSGKVTADDSNTLSP